MLAQESDEESFAKDYVAHATLEPAVAQAAREDASAREFVALGGTKCDLQNDLLKGHVFLLSSEGPDAHDVDWRKDPRVIAATIG